jgi:hypothetical protein
MASQFLGISKRLSTLRAVTPLYHSIELGGTTQVLDLMWVDLPGSSFGYTLPDAEGESSSRVVSMYVLGRRDAETSSTLPIPGLMLTADTTKLHETGPGGQEVWRTERWVMSWVDPSQPAGMDNAGQMLVAQYAGGAPGSSDYFTMQVSAATGSWTGATNLLVMDDADQPGLRRVFVLRTLNREGPSALTAAPETLMSM